MAMDLRCGPVDKGVQEAACSVRPYLDELLAPALATTVDGELAQLLDRAAGGEDVEGPLRAVLNQHFETRVFLDRVAHPALSDA